MKYILDCNSLPRDPRVIAYRRSDLAVLREVAEEWASTDPSDISKITGAGIEIIDISKKHLEKLKIVLTDHGKNLNLIRWFTNEGLADVVIIAFILSERDNPDTLFTEEYSLITTDRELTLVAESYDIKCFSKLP